ncbi:hypothetical protein BMETH_2018_0 [methanotrophic bacterial endosymbiont of Bathymodiolus sp.]|nr:hypothetical protein BMETH_2018_0 [methanotrophic bacterial endosymbiont of Bathymodiolus sp.]
MQCCELGTPPTFSFKACALKPLLIFNAPLRIFRDL